MWRRAAVCVDDDFAPGQAAIAVGSADDEPAGRVDVELVLGTHPALGQHVDDMGPDDLAHGLLVQRLGVLRRYDDRGCLDRLAGAVEQRHLAFRIGPEARLRARMPGFGERAQYGMGVIDRRRHERRCLGTSVSEHDALIAGSLVLVATCVDADRDVGRLHVEMDRDLGVLPMEAVLLIANVANRMTRHIFHGGGIETFRATNFTSENDSIGRRQGLARNPRVRIGCQICVDHRVRYAIGHLVRMTFRYGFTREEIITCGQFISPRGCMAACPAESNRHVAGVGAIAANVEPTGTDLCQ